MIEKLKGYSRSDMIQKLHEVIDVLNAYIEPSEPVMDESPRTTNDIGSQFHNHTRRVGTVDRRTTKDGDYYIGRRWGPHERRKTDRTEII